MSRLGRTLGALAASGVTLLAVVPAGDPGPAATAGVVRDLAVETIATSGAHRAAVIVDAGDGSAPKRVCIRFDANEISGEEALRLAAAEEPSLAPVLSDFGGRGKAVCALCGVGCPSGDCFCDPQRYWAYSEAEAGSTTLRASPVGISSSTVSDGDVEGYRWGSGAPPAFADVRTICGEVPATATSGPAPGPASTTTTPPAPPTTGAAPPGQDRPAPGGVGPATPGGTATTLAPVTTATTGPPATSTVPLDPEAIDGDGRPAPSDRRAATDGGPDGARTGDGATTDEVAIGPSGGGQPPGGSGSALGAAGVGLALVGMGGATVLLRRSRRAR